MATESTIESLAKQVKLLKIYVLFITVLILTMICYNIFDKKRDFSEITAQRINIIEKDGKIRMVLSNRALQHPGRMDNADLPKRDRPAGLLFFNDDGDECGGVGYNGDKKGAAMFLTMDQYKNDQIMTLSYDQDNRLKKPTRSYGFTLNDRDELPLSEQLAYFDSLRNLKDTTAFIQGIKRYKSEGHLAQRMFLGKNRSGEVGLFLTDAQGRPRLRLFINAKNQPLFQTLDERGQIISQH